MPSSSSSLSFISLLALAGIFDLPTLACSFVLTPQTSATFSIRSVSNVDKPTVALDMAGGMGMGMASKSKKKNKKKNGSIKGNGAAFDVSKSMLKSEKIYDDLLKAANKAELENPDGDSEVITQEYVIAARIIPEALQTIKGSASVSDWVPVAQMCKTRPIDHYATEADDESREKEGISSGISMFCREISYTATLSSSLFKSIPRNQIQYSAEPIESFYKFVYEDVIEGKNLNSKDDSVMTKSEARKVLELDADCNDVGVIKRSYRTLSMKLHPDRFVGVERTEEEVKQSSNDFARVKIAYESLSSGVRASGTGNVGSRNRSWYESLGGKQRTQFMGPIGLTSMDIAKEVLARRSTKCAVVGLNPETVMAFVARNQMAGSA